MNAEPGGGGAGQHRFPGPTARSFGFSAWKRQEYRVGQSEPFSLQVSCGLPGMGGSKDR